MSDPQPAPCAGLPRVVVTGSECTGKTTLAAALARHYGSVWVPEFARRFVEQKGAPPVYADVDAIARGQIALEDELAARATRLVVLDTDLLSTLVYSPHYFGDCPRWIEATLRARAGDLYLLADIDIPWVAEDKLRDRGDRRAEIHALFRAALRARELRAVEIRGTGAPRFDAARQAIDTLLEAASI